MEKPNSLRVYIHDTLKILTQIEMLFTITTEMINKPAPAIFEQPDSERSSRFLRRKTMRSFALLIFVSGVLLLFYIWLEDIVYLDKPKPWPTQPGTIIASEVREPDPAGTTGFRIYVKYSYPRGDKILEGTQIRPVELEYESKQLAENAVKKYPPGKQVEVYVNPDPKTIPHSVLEWEFPDALSPGTFVALLITMIGAIFTIIALLRTDHKPT